MKYWINGYRNEIVISFCGMCIKKGIPHEATRNIIAEVCNRTATSDFDRAEFLAKVDYQYSNRKNITNLKGISGIYEVIQVINQRQGVHTIKQDNMAIATTLNEQKLKQHLKPKQHTYKPPDYGYPKKA